MSRKARKYIVRIAAVYVVSALVMAATVWRLLYAQPPGANPPDKVAKEVDRGPSFRDEAEPYDLDAIQRYPFDYYSRVVPDRVWQHAPLPLDEEQYEPLKMLYNAFRFVEANGKQSVPMEVQAMPGRPVTFTALDTGHFANGQISVTVEADEFGYARAEFWVGDPGDFRVLAGSPENQGPVEFTMQALPAAQLKSLQSGEYARDYLAAHPEAAAPAKTKTQGPAKYTEKRTAKLEKRS